MNLQPSIRLGSSVSGFAFSPASLFASSEPGAWYDPSDLTTMFQDTAATTPVTTPGQTVALLLDKSRNGVGTNGASRRNLLTFTQQFENAAWTKLGATVSADATTAPDGTLTADRLNENTATSNHEALSSSVSYPAGTYTATIYAKPDGRTWCVCAGVTGNNFFAFFNMTGAGTVGTTATGTTAAITAVGNGWYRLSVTKTFAAPTVAGRTGFNLASADGINSYTGDGTSGAFIWGAQLETGSTATTYQVITSDWPATIPGNHATQATAASRPIYGIEPFGGRRNLLERTEQFDNAYWLKQRGSISGSYSGSSLTLQGFVEDGTTNSHRVVINGVSVTASTTYAFSCYAKANTRSAFYVSVQTGSANQYVSIVANLSDGTISATSVGATLGTILSSSISSIGDGVYRISFVYTLGTTTLVYPVIGISNSATPSFTTGGDVSYTGNSTGSVFIGGAQLETGTTATAYQRVTDQWNVTQAGVASVSYLAFDGTDDFMLTGTITPGIDKAQVFAGVRKLSDAAIGGGVIVELSTSFNNTGSFGLLGPAGTSQPNYMFVTKGTIQTAPSASGFPAPITNVVTGIGDIAGDVATLRVNGTQAAQDTGNQGSGNYLAYPLYIGRRAGTSNTLNGRIYSLIVRFGANLAAGTITQTENWVGGKTGVYTLDQINRFATLDASGVSYNAYGAADADSNYYLVPKTVLAADGTSYSVL